jgi:hypothetical protein
MTQITIQVNDRKKARVLIHFLKTLDFIEKISSADLHVHKICEKDQASDFFALAGIWAKRDISQKSLRQSAWQ